MLFYMSMIQFTFIIWASLSNGTCAVIFVVLSMSVCSMCTSLCLYFSALISPNLLLHGLSFEIKQWVWVCVWPLRCSCSDPSRHTDFSISVMYISRQHCSWMKRRQISGWISPSSGLNTHRIKHNLVWVHSQVRSCKAFDAEYWLCEYFTFIPKSTAEHSRLKVAISQQHLTNLTATLKNNPNNPLCKAVEQVYEDGGTLVFDIEQHQRHTKRSADLLFNLCVGKDSVSWSSQMEESYSHCLSDRRPLVSLSVSLFDIRHHRFDTIAYKSEILL